MLRNACTMMECTLSVVVEESRTTLTPLPPRTTPPTFLSRVAAGNCARNDASRLSCTGLTWTSGPFCGFARTFGTETRTTCSLMPHPLKHTSAIAQMIHFMVLSPVLAQLQFGSKWSITPPYSPDRACASWKIPGRIHRLRRSRRLIPPPDPGVSPNCGLARPIFPPGGDWCKEQPDEPRAADLLHGIPFRCVGLERPCMQTAAGPIREDQPCFASRIFQSKW